MINARIQADYLNLGNFGWKYYNSIKKKAMEQEFSWSGLIISLSIAFFIVIACAQGLSLLYQSIEANKVHRQTFESRIYQLEKNIRVDFSRTYTNNLVLVETFQYQGKYSNNVQILVKRDQVQQKHLNLIPPYQEIKTAQKNIAV